MKHFNKRLVSISKLMSFLLAIIFFPIYIFNFFSVLKQKPIFEINVKKILIVDLHLIGDIVLLTPVLKELKNIYPNSSVTLLSGEWAKNILLNNPDLVDDYDIYNAPWVVKKGKKNSYKGLYNVIKLIRSKEFDIAIDARGDFRNILILKLSKIGRLISFPFSGGGWLLTDKIIDSRLLEHIIHHHYRIVQYLGSNIHFSDFKPELWLSTEEKKNTHIKKKYIAVHFGASSPIRLLNFEKSKEVVNSLLSLCDNDLILFYSPEIKVLIDSIVKLPEVVDSNRVKVFRGSLREFIVAVSSASLYVGMDSAGSHIATALNVPTITIFGPAIPETCKPIGDNVEIISLKEKLYCRPCNQKVCNNLTYQKCYKDLNLFKDIECSFNKLI